MTDAAAPSDAPQVRVCAEPGCGRTSPPYKIIGRGYCERSYARWYRGRLGLAPLPNPADSPLLGPIQDAYRRVKGFERPRQQAMARFRGQVRLAYADGLSIGDLSRATGHAPMGIHEHHILPQQRRPPGGGGPPAGPDKISRWQPVLGDAAAVLAAAREQEQEARRLLADLIHDAVSPTQPVGVRVSQRLVAATLGVSAPTVGGWLRRFPATASQETGGDG